MIKDIDERNKKLSLQSVREEKIKEVIFKFTDKNGNFDYENFKKYIEDSGNNFIKEGYGLNFLGKKAAELMSSMESTTVFVPDTKHNEREENKNSENIYISADNLEALRHLKNSYRNKIKCIYIDPPYNTGSDGFCYTDSFSYDKNDLIEKLGVDEDEAERILSMQSRQGNSHSSWLSFMYARLLIARELLSDDGAIFISIDDNEYANLKLLCDEIYSENNYVSSIINKTKAGGSNDSNDIAIEHEYLLCYKKDNAIIGKIELNEKRVKEYKYEDGKINTHGKYCLKNLNDPSLQDSKGLHFDIECPDGTVLFGKNNQWKCNEKTFKERLKDDRIVFKKKANGEWICNYKIYLNEGKGKLLYDNNGNIQMRGQNLSSIQIDDLNGTDDFTCLGFNGKTFKNPKPISMIEKLLKITLKEKTIFLDFFAGASSSIHAFMNFVAKNNIRCNYIAVQIKEIPNKYAQEEGYKYIDEIGIERIKRAAKKIKEETGADIDYGFKHYTLIKKADETAALDMLEKYDPNIAEILQDKILDEFSIESRLITFLCDDGFGLIPKYDEIDLNGYKAYYIEKSLYLLDKGFDIEQCKALVSLIEDENKEINRLVLYGYAFSTREMQQLKDNLEKFDLDDDNIVVKY